MGELAAAHDMEKETAENRDLHAKLAAEITRSDSIDRKYAAMEARRATQEEAILKLLRTRCF